MQSKVISRLLTLILALLASGAAAMQERPELTVAKIMQDPNKWIGSSPERPFWSEDSRWIYFYWNPENADADSLYKVDARGGEPIKVSLAEQRRMPAASGVYTRDYRKKLFVREGDIFLYDVRRDELTRITKTSAREGNASFSQDESAVIFQEGDNLFRWELATGHFTQLVDLRKGEKPEDDPAHKTAIEKYLKQEELELIRTLRERKEKRERQREANRARRDAPPTIYVPKKYNISNLVLSPDGRFITMRLQEEARDSKQTMVPNYVDDSGYTQELRARPKVGSPQTTSVFAFADLQNDTLIYVKPDSLPGIFDDLEHTTIPAKSGKGKAEGKKDARDTHFFGPVWSDDGRSAFVVVRSLDNKDRWLAVLDLPAGTLRPIEHQRDEAWIGGPNIASWNFTTGDAGWLPDNERIWFCSEETGYSHLYTYNIRTGQKTALTAGDFEIYSPALSRDKKKWYFSANRVHPGERHFYSMPINGGEWEKLTSLPGRNDAEISPDERQLLIRHSYMNKPWELYVQRARAGSEARQLTFSTTDEWRSYPWRVPEIVRIPAGDGARPYARLYRPENPNGAGVIFVHGAGYLQNAHKWWSSYFREYMFHNLLADKGYTVLDIDYRGSAGYGRDWRTAIYRHMGGKDLSDHVDGAKWMAAELGIDPQRIGIYGGSYGGFITLMAMFTAPEVFKAGAALRAVTDWAHYNHPYTSNILNIPPADTVAFRRSSPIYFAEGLRGHLLICHGMIDTNVHFQDVVRLAQRLIELGKENWEFAVYPLEGHGFVEPSAWTDEYRRILKLFEATLR